MTRRHCTAGRCFCGRCGSRGANWPPSEAVQLAMQAGWPLRRSGAQRRGPKAERAVTPTPNTQERS